jgi:hypothetical protein
LSRAQALATKPATTMQAAALLHVGPHVKCRPAVSSLTIDTFP